MERRLRGSRTLVGTVGALLLVASACTPAPTGTATAPSGAAAPSAAAASAAVPKRGGELKFQLLRDSTTGYDPALATESTVFVINSAIFDTLAEIQPDGSIVPALAESWTISTDGLTYTFKIRSGVKFHNGRAMTATDVKYTIDRLRDPATKSPRAGIYAVLTSVDAPDATTVTLKLKEPYAPLLSAFADITAGIVPQEVVLSSGGTLNSNPVGTGPFKFVSWTRDQLMKVTANKDYWRTGLPRLDGITFSFNADSNARAAAIRSKDVDFLWNAPPELNASLKKESTLDLLGGKGTLTWQYLNLNMQKEPFKDVRVRQAIYNAIDRDEILKVSRPDTGTPLNAGFLPPEHWAGVKDIVYKPDVAKATKLLADAGFANGFEFTILALTGSDFHILTAQTIQQQLKALKITVKVQVVDSGTQTAAQRNGTFEGIVSGFSGTIDPDERFAQTFMAGGGTNYAKFSDAKVDELVIQARKTTSRDERANLYRQAQLRVADIGAHAFVFNYHPYDAIQKFVKGYVFNPQLVSYRVLRDVWLDK